MYNFKKVYPSMSRHMIKLPFDVDALEPHISAQTVDIHYNKHHQGYATNLENLIAHTPANAPYAGLSLESMIQTSHGEKNWAIYNNAAQTWNHNFYWQSLCPPQASEKPTAGAFFDAISARGGFESVASDLVQMGMSQFASGWAWLVRTETGALDIRKTSNADPVWLNHSDHPLLIVDVWEHAYYLDYQNRRADHLKGCAPILNWAFAQRQFDQGGSSFVAPNAVA